MPLPNEPFRVVANLPFGSETSIVRRLLAPGTQLEQADLVVDFGFARKRAAVWPSTVLGVCWSARFELVLVRRLPRGCFEPPPTVDAAVLRITRRGRPLVPRGDERDFHAFVRDRFAHGLPRTPAAKRCARGLGIRPGTPPREVDAYQWAALYACVRRTGYSARDT